MLSLVRHLTLFSGKNPTCFYFRIWLVNKITPTYIQSLTCRTLKFLPPEPPNTCLSNTIAVLFVFSVSNVCNVQKHCVYITHVGLHSNVQTVWKPTVDVQLHWFVKTCFLSVIEVTLANILAKTNAPDECVRSRACFEYTTVAKLSKLHNLKGMA